MKTKIEEFWEYFLEIQYTLLYEYKYGDKNKFDEMFSNLHTKLTPLRKGMELITVHSEYDFQAALVVLTKGNPHLRILGIQLLEQAPLIDNWEFYLGVPYKGYSNGVILPFKNKDLLIVPEQIWVHIHKQYRTSNKLHLEVYVDTKKKGISKHSLHVAVDNLFLAYFGDEIYYTRISRFRILRRKFKNRNFIPLFSLRDLFVYNYVT